MISPYKMSAAGENFAVSEAAKWIFPYKNCAADENSYRSRPLQRVLPQKIICFQALPNLDFAAFEKIPPLFQIGT